MIMEIVLFIRHKYSGVMGHQAGSSLSAGSEKIISVLYFQLFF